MFLLAISIGIYSYFILALGFLGILYKQIIVLLTLFYIAIIIFFIYRGISNTGKILQYFQVLKKFSKIEFLYFFLLGFQAMINLIGALGPELGFDALWYHLTIPKIYLENHSIFFIPGSLLYYSLMPKLAGMLYTAAIAINGEILAKLIHFSFGILSCIALYKLSRIFLSFMTSLLAVVIFYSNLVVGWQSITAYIDLARTFFEVMALWGFINWWKKGEIKWLVESAVMVGLAISTKLLAVGSLVIFSALFIFLSLFKYPPRRSHGFFASWRIQPATTRGVRGLIVYWIIGLLVPLPWFVFSFVHTGNPLYPFFTDTYKVSVDMELINPLRFISDVWNMFTQSADPLSPVYIIFLPLVIFLYKKFNPEVKLVAIYSLFALTVWYLTPRTGGGRFIMPYLPAFSIVVAGVIEKLRPPRRSPFGHLRGDFRVVLVIIVIIVSLISIFYRGIANSKYMPVIIGQQKKDSFLSQKLNFFFGDFYDTDGYFKKNIKADDKVLLYGFHNLYYVDFPFVDSSWVKKGDEFNYVAVQNSDLPKRFNDWELVYQNLKTKIKLYSKGGIKWPY